MARVAQTHQDQLERIKENIEKSYTYFKKNCDRFNEYRRFVFETTIDSQVDATYSMLKKPKLEFNILEAYISRLLGEFSKQEPSVQVMAGDEKPVDSQLIEVVQGHLRHILSDANKQGFEYHIYKDLLSGGFSVGKILTEYASEMSMNQVIKMERVYDPVLCGFDPLAKLPHKGDGQYCFEIYPKLKKEFEREHPDVELKEMKFQRKAGDSVANALGGFNWSYKNGKEDILLECLYYEKKKKKAKIARLSNGQVITLDNYKKFEEHWNNLGLMQQMPVIVGKPRLTEIETICRYHLIETTILEYVETDFKILPLIFFDGNSILIRHEISGEVHQMTRPYVYQAKGIQMLKNFAGVTLANELENMVQHKFKISKEALPNEEDYMEAYRDVQKADVLVYNAFDPNRPDVQLQPPMEIQRVPIPPEVTNTFIGADQMTQVILGNFDMDMAKLSGNQISGVAMQEAITQSNTAAMPYVVGYLQGLSRLLEGATDLLPKYFVTPRTIPVVDAKGMRDYVKINQQGGIQLQYDENSLNVKVEPGVNFAVQQGKAYTFVKELMQVSPLFNQFINTEGLDILLDNIDIKGIDSLKERTEQWMQNMRKMQQQQQQQAQNMPNPDVMKMQIEQSKLQAQQVDNHVNAQLKMMEHQIKQVELQQKAQDAQLHAAVAVKKADTEIKAHQIDASIAHNDQLLAVHDQIHRHGKDLHEMKSKETEKNEQKTNV